MRNSAPPGSPSLYSGPVVRARQTAFVTVLRLTHASTTSRTADGVVVDDEAIA